MVSPDIETLLAPKSVAVVGASPDSWYSSNLVENLLAYGYGGAVYLVNPNRDRAWDRPCHESLSAVPEVVDLAVVCVPRTLVVDVIREAGELGVPSALVITAGFAESGDEGAALEAELARAVDEYGIVTCGPNCIGIANPREETVLTSTCSRKPTPGSVALVSQSGALAFTTFFERGADTDLGFSHIVSTGNEVGLTLPDYVSYLAEDPTVDVVCTYLEGVDDPTAFRRAAETAVRHDTPVIAVKVGRSAQADRVALSHTGSLTGNDDAWNGLFEQSGTERVEDIPDLLGRARVHAAFDAPATDRVCIASTSGGLASLLADLASERDIELSDLSAATQSKLKGIEDLLAFDDLNNPIDIRGAGAGHLPSIADAVFSDENFDAYVFAIGLSAVDDDAEQIADDLLTVARRASAPVLVLWTGRTKSSRDGPLPYERVRRAVPLFVDPGRCMDALQSLIEFRDRRARLADAREARPTVEVAPPTTTGVLTWDAATSFLGDAGIDPVDSRTVTSATDAVDAATSIGYPVVLKVDAAAVPHRADAAAVRLGVQDADAVTATYEEIVGNARRHAGDETIDRVIVQPQVEGGVEAIVGVSRDDAFGATVSVGIGGSLAELVGDVAVRVPPVGIDEARRAIDATNLGPAVRATAGDSMVDELAELVSRVGDLALAVESLEELDLNPVIVREDSLSVVDILVRTSEPST